MKKNRTKTEKWAEYYDQADILVELNEGPAEFSLDDQLLQDILKNKKWKNFSLAEPAGFAEKTREGISSKAMR